MEMLLNIFAILVQSVEFAHVLDKFIVNGGQFLHLDFMQLNLEHSGLALQFFCMIILGECHIHVKLVANVVAYDLIFEAGDKLAGAQSQLIVVGLAAVKLFAIHIAVKIDGDNVAVLGSTVLHVDNAGVALTHTVDFPVDILSGNFHGHLGDLNALVAFDGGFGLGDNIQLAHNALILAALIDLELANADDLQAGLLHSLHHHGTIQMIDSGFVEHFLTVIFFNKRPGSMAFPEAGNIHLFAFALVNGVDGVVKFFGADLQLQFIAVGFHFVSRFYIHVSDFLSK